MVLKIMFIIWLILIFIIAYNKSPKLAKWLAFGLNLLLPDPIPYIDEIIMIATIIK